MKQIFLTKGMISLVDDEDYDYLSNLGSWHHSSSGYAAKRSGCIIYMHRILMGAKKGDYIDHINGNKLDNRRLNLRFCTNRQNAMNSKIRTDNKSGFKGVSFVNRERKWLAQICVEGKMKWIGYFDCKIKAAIAYNEAAIKHFGEFASLNKIPV